ASPTQSSAPTRAPAATTAMGRSSSAAPRAVIARSSRHRHPGDRALDRADLGDPLDLRLGAADQAVAQSGDTEVLDVLGDDVVATVAGGQRLGAEEQRDRPARAGTEAEVGRGAGCRAELGDVA